MTQSIKLMRMACFALLIIGFTAAFTVHPGASPRYFTKVRSRLADTADVNIEFARLQAVYSGQDHLSFDANASQVTITGPDTSFLFDVFHYKISGNKYSIRDDSTLQMQDSSYHITVLDNQKMITIDRPNYFFQTLLIIDLLNPDFQQDNVQSVIVRDTSFMRKISFQFYRESVFKSFNILYDTGTYKLEGITGSMSTQSAISSDSAADAGQRISISMQFANFQFGTFTDTVFNMSRYFTRQRDSFVFAPPYNTYQFVNATLD